MKFKMLKYNRVYVFIPDMKFTKCHTILQIVEFDEGFDTEVFFMYVFIAAGAILLLFLGFSFLSSRKYSLNIYVKVELYCNI